MENKTNTSCILILLSFVVGLTGTLAGAALASNLWWVAPGTRIRPINLVFEQIILSVATAILGTGLGILALFFVHWRWKLLCLSILAILCSYIPMYVANAISNWIIASHHLILEG